MNLLRIYLNAMKPQGASFLLSRHKKEENGLELYNVSYAE